MQPSTAIAALTVLCLLAGCAEPTAPGEPVQDQEQRVAGRPLDSGGGVLTQSYTLTINPDTELIAFGGASENCVFFWDTDGASYTILAGNATLTWTETPNTPEFRIRVTGASQDVAGAYMGSPATLALKDLEADNWGIGFWADYTVVSGTMPAAQTATLQLDFEYEGDLPSAGVGTCAGGGA